MKNLALSILAATAVGVITVGQATAMPFSTNTGSTVLSQDLVHDARVVCNRRGQCWNTNRSMRRSYQTRRYYDRPGYYAQPSYGYYGGPRVGVGIGPFGFGMY